MSEKDLQNVQAMDEAELEQVQGGAVVQKQDKPIDFPWYVDLVLDIATAPLPGPAFTSTAEELVKAISK